MTSVCNSISKAETTLLFAVCVFTKAAVCTRRSVRGRRPVRRTTTISVPSGEAAARKAETARGGKERQYTLQNTIPE